MAGYLYLPGVTGEAATIPSASSLDLTGDSDTRAKAFFTGILWVFFFVWMIIGLVIRNHTMIWMGFGFILGIPILLAFWWYVIGGREIYHVYQETRPNWQNLI